MKINFSNRFKRDYQKYKKKHFDMNKLSMVFKHIQNDEFEVLINRYRLHQLKGNWIGHYELHVDNDWLLIYVTEDSICTLIRLGSHDELFKG
ncbi:type II toxin-antitoxin system YafQ family toxin [Atopobacter sp. AH10]|uniref:type II toxin-antitoxin system RelE/ParE family toxin n=1 Tax=Atopobacter sp. AH10 TaxID=2315861 RepID=UPI000EF2587B|nr:type II toxin-antitoxin system YafQ family toxin [Atopobacter sp. AH10]RLK63142.1 type II toxin-antitoxin system YafQ family toxin [Atopobacter sp. AH10]